MLIVLQIPREHFIYTTMKQRTVEYNEKSNDLSSEARHERFGVPNIHAWNGFLQDLTYEAGYLQYLVSFVESSRNPAKR